MSDRTSGNTSGNTSEHEASKPKPEKRPTLKMVAEAAGVSTATVSYVLSGRPGGDAHGSGISEHTARNVRETAARLRYHPNRAAQAIRTGRTGVVLLSLHMLSDPWSLAVADAVNVEANKHDLTTMILADGDWFAALERQACDIAYIYHVGSDSAAPEKLASLAARGQRLVVFSETLAADGYDTIRSDAIPGCYLAVDHLLERHAKIGCLATEEEFTGAGVTRYTPYVERLTAAGIPINRNYIDLFSATQASAFSAAIRLLSQPDRPTALYVTTDFAAIQAINAAHRLGLRVPEDIAVIGVGNTPDAQLVTPTLTTVGPSDFYERQAEIIIAQSLVDVTELGTVHEFDWTLHAGESTALSDSPVNS